MARFRIRRIRPADAAAFRALRLRALAEHPDAFTSSYEEDVQLPLAAYERRLGPGSGVSFWGAFVESDGSADGAGVDDAEDGPPGTVLVGVVGLERHPRRKIRHKATVVFMYVYPEHGGRGLGAALLRRLLRVATRAPVLEHLQLTVTAGNDRARGLYERAGFRAWGTEPRAVRVGDAYHDKIHMMLYLAT